MDVIVFNLYLLILIVSGIYSAQLNLAFGGSEVTVREIVNKDLTLSDIPSSDASWGEFALTFDGYNVWGSFDKCAEIANARRHESLTDLRTCLFFEQRRWRHFGEDPDEEAMMYLRGVIEKIRSRVTAGDVT